MKKKSLVLLPYEFTLLQNLKRGYLKLLPVYVSQNIQLHFIISRPFFQKNILSAMLVQICSTTLRFCTSSNVQIGIRSCYRRKSLANTLLQNLKRGLKLLPVYVSQGFQLHFITSPFSLSRKNHINCHNVQERSERLCEISLKEYSKVAFLWFLLILYQNHPKTRSCPGERNHFG